MHKGLYPCALIFKENRVVHEKLKKIFVRALMLISLEMLPLMFDLTSNECGRAFLSRAGLKNPQRHHGD